MQFTNKIAIANHLLYLGIISVFIALLLTFVIDSLYVPDPLQCELTNHQIINECKDGEDYHLEIRNSGDISFSVVFNKEMDKAIRITPNSVKSINLETDKSTIQTNLMVVGEKGDHLCKLTQTTTDINLIKRC